MMRPIELIERWVWLEAYVTGIIPQVCCESQCIPMPQPTVMNKVEAPMRPACQAKVAFYAPTLVLTREKGQFLIRPRQPHWLICA